jgi:hypothetical protein
MVMDQAPAKGTCRFSKFHPALIRFPVDIYMPGDSPTRMQARHKIHGD